MTARGLAVLTAAALALPGAGCFHFADDGEPPFEITRFESVGSSDDLSASVAWSISDPEGSVERCELWPGDGPIQEVDCDAGYASHHYPSEGSYTMTLSVWSADDSVTASAAVLAEQLPLPPDE